MTQPAGQKPIDTQHAKIQEPVQEKGSAFGRVMGFITAPIANAWHYMFASEPVKEKQLPERVITQFDEDHVLKSGPGEGLTIGQSQRIYDIMQNSLLTPQQKQQEKAKVLGIAAEPKDDYESGGKDPLEILRDENRFLKELVAKLSERSESLETEALDHADTMSADDDSSDLEVLSEENLRLKARVADLEGRLASLEGGGAESPPPDAAIVAEAPPPPPPPPPAPPPPSGAPKASKQTKVEELLFVTKMKEALETEPFLKFRLESMLFWKEEGANAQLVALTHAINSLEKANKQVIDQLTAVHKGMSDYASKIQAQEGCVKEVKVLLDNYTNRAARETAADAKFVLQSVGGKEKHEVSRKKVVEELIPALQMHLQAEIDQLESLKQEVTKLELRKTQLEQQRAKIPEDVRTKFHLSESVLVKELIPKLAELKQDQTGARSQLTALNKQIKELCRQYKVPLPKGMQQQPELTTEAKGALLGELKARAKKGDPVNVDTILLFRLVE